MNDVPLPAKSRSGSSIRELATQMTSEPLGWLRGEIDRLFDDFGRPGRSIFNFGSQSIAPVPAIDFTEEGDQYRLTAELPGLGEKDVEISIADGMLTLSGEKKEQSEKKEGDYVFSERRYGSFSRQVALPGDVDPEKIGAQFKDGVLTVTMAKDHQAPPRKRTIAIEKG